MKSALLSLSKTKDKKEKKEDMAFEIFTHVESVGQPAPQLKMYSRRVSCSVIAETFIPSGLI